MSYTKSWKHRSNFRAQSGRSRSCLENVGKSRISKRFSHVELYEIVKTPIEFLRSIGKKQKSYRERRKISDLETFFSRRVTQNRGNTARIFARNREEAEVVWRTLEKWRPWAMLAKAGVLHARTVTGVIGVRRGGFQERVCRLAPRMRQY